MTFSGCFSDLHLGDQKRHLEEAGGVFWDVHPKIRPNLALIFQFPIYLEPGV